MIEDFVEEFARYRKTAERAIQQVTDEALNTVVSGDINSIAVIIRHMSGNFASRFTGFLSSDGEKPWRDRDSEFEDRRYTREEIERIWAEGWTVLEVALSALTDEHLQQRVLIRGQPWTVHDALCRSIAHAAQHVGQIVLLARILTAGNWKSISIPRGKSREYNINPTKERKPE